MLYLEGVGINVLSISQFRKAKIRARWFRCWNPELDRALEALPESECCPHELYRLLCNHLDSSIKRFAIIYDERGEPIGVVSLRKRSNDWVPLTHYTIPGMIFPVKKGSLGKVLCVLKHNVSVAWWRMGELCEHIDGIRSLEVKPTYAIDFYGGFEEYWRTSHHIRPIRRAQKRCEGLVVAINAENMAGWVTRTWERKWREVPTVQRSDLEDKLLAAIYLERRGKYFTFTLHDKGNPVGGHTFLVHDGSLVWHYTYRDPRYDELGAGTYLMNYAVQWGIASGFKGIDLGADHPEHKKRWGPIKGSKTSIHICPEYVALIGKGQELLNNVRKNGIGQYFVIATTKVIDRMRKVV